MTSGQHNQANQPISRSARAHRRHTLAAHRAFAPMLGIWGAALAGLPIMVLPSWMIADAGKGTGLSLLGDQAQTVIAGLAALVLGVALFFIANLISHNARRRAGPPSIASLAARRVHTIDPQRDLGSISLDEPVKSVPFAAAVPPAPSGPPAEPTAEPAPRALDLAAFAQLPGRNGVWVEDQPELAEPATAPVPPTVQPAAAQTLRLAPEPDRRRPAAATAAAPDSSAAALARLRAVPPEQLSIVQMVERFAAALHDHREAAPGTAAAARDITAREAALAQALRALAALSGESSANAAAPGEPLREALARLQGLRGTA